MKSEERKSIKELPPAELTVRLKECEEKLFKLRFMRLAVPSKNSFEIRNLRSLRARLLTWLKEKESNQKGKTA